MLAEQHTLKMSFFHKFSFTINGMETLYFNSFCKRFTVRKCLHIHFGFIYAFSLFPVPYQKVTALFRRNIKFSELCHGVITHLQRWKAPRAKKKIITNVALTAARNNEFGRTPYYLKQQHILLVQFTREHKQGKTFHFMWNIQIRRKNFKLVWIDLLSWFEIYWWKALSKTKGIFKSIVSSMSL